MNDRHAELKKQYEIDANYHPRPWELWEVLCPDGTWVTSRDWDNRFGPRWYECSEYRRKPDAPVWPTEPEKAGHFHAHVLEHILSGGKLSDFEATTVSLDKDFREVYQNWVEADCGMFPTLLLTGAAHVAFRRKVAMHQIVPGGPKFPAPLVEAPEMHAIVYRPDPYHDAAAEIKWIDLSHQRQWLENGLLHSTPAGAVAQAKAIAHAAKGTPV